MLYSPGLGYSLAAILTPFLLLPAPAAAQQHAGSYSASDVERGSRLYGPHCVACHGANGDQVAGVDFRRGNFRRGSTDEDVARVIVEGIKGTAMPPNNFTYSEAFTIVAYLRSMRDFGARQVALGDAGRGKAIFHGKGDCASCHRVNGQGARLAVDLSDIGAIRPAEALERALVEPSATVLPQNRFLRVTTKDGRNINGRRLNEDTYTIQLMDDRERLVSISKADIREYSVVRSSAMPSYKDKLTAAERADLVAYLVSLKGANK